MTQHYYTDTASVATLSTGISAIATTWTLNSFTGWPALTPFWAELDRGTGSAETVEVTGVVGSVVTVTRGMGGTVATTHAISATFEHVASAAHFNDAEAHIAATTGVHGASGSIVGTTGNQTIQDKEYRGKHTHRFTDALPAGVTAGVEVHEDSAAARDGVAVRNTAGDTARRAFLLDQAGTPRFEVFNDGTVAITPNGAAVRPGIDVVGKVQGDSLQIDGVATITGATATGALTTTGAASVSGTATVGALTSSGAVSGTTGTFSGAVAGTTGTFSGAISGTSITGSGTVAGATVTSSGAVTATGNVSGANLAATTATTTATLAASGAITEFGGSIPLPASQPTNPGSPVSGQLVYRTDLNDQYRYDGAVWVPTRQIAGRLISAAGVQHNAVTTTETNITKLQIENYKILINTWYIFNITLFFITSAVGDVFTVRVRKDTALSGTILTDWSIVAITAAAVGDTRSIALPWKATATDTDADFYVSVLRTSGSGDIDIYGDRRSAFWINDRGADTAVWSES